MSTPEEIDGIVTIAEASVAQEEQLAIQSEQVVVEVPSIVEVAAPEAPVEAATPEPTVEVGAPEAPVEAATPEPIVPSLATLVSTLLKDTEFAKGYLTIASPAVLASLQTFVDADFQEMETILRSVVADGHIDSRDIPLLVTLLEKVYPRVLAQKREKGAMVANLVKLLAKLLVDAKLFYVPEDKQADFFKLFFEIVDACSGLVILSTLTRKKSCLGCF